MPSSDPPGCPYVSRGGFKLAAAIDAFSLDPTGATCADLGCSTGGFVDCWLQHGAAKVYAVDTAYGTLDWKLRNDPRVVVMERHNALHAKPPEAQAAVDFVSVDLGWTKQDRAIPAALEWLAPGSAARIVTLIKPHYEIGRPRLSDDEVDRVVRDTLDAMPGLGVRVLGDTPSPIVGSKGRNREHLALLAPVATE